MKRITDWDDAYANGAHIAGAAAFPAHWAETAEIFRQNHPPQTLAYGPGPREKLDLFPPRGAARGLFLFIHGGYWMRFGREDWSYLARAALRHGWAAALPSYPLCPEARISRISNAIFRAAACAASQVDGPLIVSGHSAGGHLAARLLCADAPAATRARIRTVCPISGLHDLRPLMRTEINRTLRLDEAEALAESPALLSPAAQARLICWVGARERPEFLRQNALLANIWRGCGLETEQVEEPGRHHFDVIEGLAQPESALARQLFETE